MVPRGDRRAGPAAPARADRAQFPRREESYRRPPTGHPRGGTRRWRRGRPRGAHPDRLLREPARDRAGARRTEGAARRSRCHACDRHPVDAQPPRRLAPAGRRTRVDTRAVGAMVRGDEWRACCSGDTMATICERRRSAERWQLLDVAGGDAGRAPGRARRRRAVRRLYRLLHVVAVRSHRTRRDRHARPHLVRPPLPCAGAAERQRAARLRRARSLPDADRRQVLHL